MHLMVDKISRELDLDKVEEAEEIGEIFTAMSTGNTDFTVGDYRLIRSDMVQEILQDEISSDEYVLGSFNADFISSVTGWPVELINIAQDAEKYSALGKAIIEEGYVEDLAKEYAAADGLAHHFSLYDGSTEIELHWSHVPGIPQVEEYYIAFKVD